MQELDSLLDTGIYETITPEREMLVSDLLKDLNLESKYFGILVNGKSANENTKISPKDSVVVLPHIAGGM